MPERPFLFTDKVTLSANSTGSLQFQCSAGEEFDGDELYIVSTGAFSIEDIRDNAGRRYSNCSASEPILSTMLNKPQTAGLGIYMFKVPIHIDPAGIFYIDLKDTSAGANAVTAVLNGKKITV